MTAAVSPNPILFSRFNTSFLHYHLTFTVKSHFSCDSLAERYARSNDWAFCSNKAWLRFSTTAYIKQLKVGCWSEWEHSTGEVKQCKNAKHWWCSCFCCTDSKCLDWKLLFFTVWPENVHSHTDASWGCETYYIYCKHYPAELAVRTQMTSAVSKGQCDALKQCPKLTISTTINNLWGDS